MATQKKVAEHIDLSSRRVRELIKDGVLPASKGTGGLDVDACRLAYVRYLRGLSTGQVKENSTDPNNEKKDYPDLLDKERHRKLKRENDIDDKLVAPVLLLTEALEKAASMIVPALESLPLEIKRKFPEVTGGQINIVKKTVATCRNAIADMELNLDY
jgi:phage terminase Nu1 subunit (DNA packaging protein)